ncbi:hypothetical protein ACFE04_020369 [Oxalis oulophora]
MDAGAHGATFTIRNNCDYTVWPGILAAIGSPPAIINRIRIASPSINKYIHSSIMVWSSVGSDRMWDQCKRTIFMRYWRLCLWPSCLQWCRWSSTSIVDRLPPIGGSGSCKSTSCPADINAVCPSELAVKGVGGRVIGCKSACLALKQPQYCCTGAFSMPYLCGSSKYAQIFKSKCPQANSYAYDDEFSTFTCTGGPNYLITFCP